MQRRGYFFRPHLRSPYEKKMKKKNKQAKVGASLKRNKETQFPYWPVWPPL
jgi:hypothetical protein